MKPRILLSTFLICTITLVVTSNSVSADLIYLRGKGQSKASVLRGKVSPMEDGRIKVILGDGSEQIVQEGDIVALIAEGAARGNVPEEHRRTGEADRIPSKNSDTSEEKGDSISRESTNPTNAGEGITGNSGDGTSDTVAKPEGTGENAGTNAPSKSNAAARGFWALKKNATWVRNDGQREVTRTIVDVRAENNRTVVHEEMTPKGGKTILSQIIIEQRGDKTIYQRKVGNQSPETVLVEPLMMGTEWKDKDGMVWKVVETGLDYTDVGNNRHNGCVKVQAHDAASGKPVPGSVWVFAPKVGRVNNGLLSFKEGTE